MADRTNTQAAATLTEVLDALPEGTEIVDHFNDKGIKRDGLWHFPETAPLHSAKVAKYGPIRVLPRTAADDTKGERP